MQETQEQELSAGSMELRSGVSRRNFLVKAVMGGTAAATAGLLTRHASAAIDDPNQDAAAVFHSIQKHENDHVMIIQQLLGSLARPKPSFTGLEKMTYPDFLALSQVFENTGVGAYLGAVPSLFDPGLIVAAATILTVEARHAGVLNVFSMQPVTPDNKSFDQPMTMEEVVNAVSPFVTNLNGGPPLTFSTTPSQSNDMAIANFALALEFLEAEFYNLNVSRFFPS